MSAVGRLVALGIGIVLAAAGCGPPPMCEVRGFVRLDGVAVSGCKVGLFPDTPKFDPDRHGFGFGITDDEGAFVIQHPQGESGIRPGAYKVTLVAWVDRSGNPVPAESKPSEVEGGVRNRFPDMYEAPSTTPGRATVSRAGDNRIELDIRTQP